jgi:protoporphyrinogen/coproporphyrinogen III oxidase
MAKPKVTIIGAGFSGLVSAYFLHRDGFDVEIFEAKSQAGGLISTKHESFGLVETAANGILNSALVEELFASINCEMIPTKREARARYIMREKPRKWPLGFGETLTMLRFLFSYLFMKRKVAPKTGETVSQWGTRVLSKDISRFTIETALQGIYAGNPVKMSASLIVGQLFAKKKKQKLKFRGTVSARNGMGELIQKLTTALEQRGVKFHYGKTLESVSNLHKPIVVATDAENAARLLESTDPERARAIGTIEILPIVTVTAAFAKEDLNYKGFGCLFPPNSSRALGVLMNNYIFDGRADDKLSETWIFGGAQFAGPRREQLLSLSDEDFVDMIVIERKRVFGSDLRPEQVSVTRWPKALPHYTTDLEKNLEVINRNNKEVFLIGNYIGGIGLTKILEQASQVSSKINGDT